MPQDLSAVDGNEILVGVAIAGAGPARVSGQVIAELRGTARVGVDGDRKADAPCRARTEEVSDRGLEIEVPRIGPDE